MIFNQNKTDENRFTKPKEVAFLERKHGIHRVSGLTKLYRQ